MIINSQNQVNNSNHPNVYKFGVDIMNYNRGENTHIVIEENQEKNGDVSDNENSNDSVDKDKKKVKKEKKFKKDKDKEKDEEKKKKRLKNYLQKLAFLLGSHIIFMLTIIQKLDILVYRRIGLILRMNLEYQ